MTPRTDFNGLRATILILIAVIVCFCIWPKTMLIVLIGCIVACVLLALE